MAENHDNLSTLTNNTVMGPGIAPIDVLHEPNQTVREYVQRAQELDPSFQPDLERSEISISGKPAKLTDIVHEPGSLIDISPRFVNGKNL